LFFDQSENLLKLLIWTKAYQIVVWVAAIGFGGLNQSGEKDVRQLGNEITKHALFKGACSLWAIG
jgi:hypothetical protein